MGSGAEDKKDKTVASDITGDAKLRVQRRLAEAGLEEEEEQTQPQPPAELQPQPAADEPVAEAVAEPVADGFSLTNPNAAAPTERHAEASEPLPAAEAGEEAATKEALQKVVEAHRNDSGEVDDAKARYLA